MTLPGDPNLPPGMANRDIDGTPCPQCGECGCDCKRDEDPRSYRQRVADEKAEMSDGH